MQAIKQLTILPASHAIFKEISDEKVVFYCILKWKYKIVFTINNDLLEVVVVQVYHGARGQEWITKQFK